MCVGKVKECYSRYICINGVIFIVLSILFIMCQSGGANLNYAVYVLLQ